MIPSEERYGALITVLRSTTGALNTAKDDKTRLSLSLTALRQVILYLHGDREVLVNLLTRPLTIIECAVHDASRGAIVPFLEHSPTGATSKPGSKPGSKPSDLSREAVQGQLAFAFELLLASNMNHDEAAKWVANKARLLGVRSLAGAVIVASQIKSWRSEIKSKRAPKGACETFDGLRSVLPQYDIMLKSPRAMEKREMCKALAIGVINTVASTAPQAAPNTNERKSGQ